MIESESKCTSLDPDAGDTSVALAGDWHENLDWVIKILQILNEREIRTVYHLGDFGIWPSKRGFSMYLEALNNLCQKFDMRIWVTPGNHQDWSAEPGIGGVDQGGVPRRILPHTQNLFVFPRGYRWTHSGRSFVSLGGAPSVDWQSRKVDHDWFVEEMISEETAEEVAAAGHTEIMLTHDVPNLDIPPVRPGAEKKYWRAGARNVGVRVTRSGTARYRLFGSQAALIRSRSLSPAGGHVARRRHKGPVRQQG